MRFNYTKALERLTDYAYKLGFTEVIFDHDDTSTIVWYPRSINTPLRIKIEGKNPVELKVYLLLHELGHHLLRKDWEKFALRIPILHYAESTYDIKYRRRQAYIVASMEEEFKAWDEGLKLAERFEIRINRSKWDEYRSKCLMSYMRMYSSLRK